MTCATRKEGTSPSFLVFRWACPSRPSEGPTLAVGFAIRPPARHGPSSDPHDPRGQCVTRTSHPAAAGIPCMPWLYEKPPVSRPCCAELPTLPSAWHGCGKRPEGHQEDVVRIAQVAPLYESVPPRLYGGTERVVHYLTEELVRRGHDVTLFASGDSTTRARLVAPRITSLRLDGADSVEATVAHALEFELLAQRAERGAFDVVHIHCDQSVWPILRRLPIPHVTTLHGRLDLPSLRPLFQAFNDFPLVSISDAHRAPAPEANWEATVHHGLPEALLECGSGGGGYLAFLGRMSPEKRPDLAIEIAERVGIPVKMAAKVDGADREYFAEVVEPRLRASRYAEYIGELDDAGKNEFLGGAKALLFPIDWPEPFGLAMIEALACGTPVIAFDRGSVPEVIRHGVNGFIVSSVEEAARAVECLHMIDRANCRADFEQRFSATRMARDYLDVYARVAKKQVPAWGEASGQLAIA